MTREELYAAADAYLGALETREPSGLAWAAALGVLWAHGRVAAFGRWAALGCCPARERGVSGGGVSVRLGLWRGPVVVGVGVGGLPAEGWRRGMAGRAT